MITGRLKSCPFMHNEFIFAYTFSLEELSLSLLNKSILYLMFNKAISLIKEKIMSKRQIKISKLSTTIIVLMVSLTFLPNCGDDSKEGTDRDISIQQDFDVPDNYQSTESCTDLCWGLVDTAENCGIEITRFDDDQCVDLCESDSEAEFALEYCNNSCNTVTACIEIEDVEEEQLECEDVCQSYSCSCPDGRFFNSACDVQNGICSSQSETCEWACSF